MDCETRTWRSPQQRTTHNIDNPGGRSARSAGGTNIAERWPRIVAIQCARDEATIRSSTQPNAVTSTIRSQIMIIDIPEPCTGAGVGLCAGIEWSAAGIDVACDVPEPATEAVTAGAAVVSIEE